MWETFNLIKVNTRRWLIQPLKASFYVKLNSLKKTAGYDQKQLRLRKQHTCICTALLELPVLSCDLDVLVVSGVRFWHCNSLSLYSSLFSNISLYILVFLPFLEQCAIYPLIHNTIKDLNWLSPCCVLN